MSRKRRRSAPWALPKLLEADRNAATVYLALCWLANGTRQVRTTRNAITKVCGLHKDTITSAIKALHDAGWIQRAYGAVTGRRWYRITITEVVIFPWAVKTGSSARPKRKTRTHENRSKGRVPLDRKNPPYSLKRVGGALQPPPLTARAGAAAGTHTGSDTHTAQEEQADRPIAEIVREACGDV